MGWGIDKFVRYMRSYRTAADPRSDALIMIRAEVRANLRQVG